MAKNWLYLRHIASLAIRWNCNVRRGLIHPCEKIFAS